jgi:SAM-dependent methyltransferase
MEYQVVSIDASVEMVRATTQLTGHEARVMKFSALNFENDFDGIWACASLLHVSRRKLGEVLGRFWSALKPDGVLYMSFKYGDSERMEEGRFFNDMNEDLLRSFLPDDRWRMLKLWLTDDVRQERQSGIKWLNAIVRRLSSRGEQT